MRSSILIWTTLLSHLRAMPVPLHADMASRGIHSLFKLNHSLMHRDEELLPPNPRNTMPSHTGKTSPGEFPMCTEENTPFPPFCLPHHGADVTVDATYYVTWNADFYPANAKITIELRYANSTQGDSAFTSGQTVNSYGYLPVHMQSDWLQGKPQNALTLYIIELEPTSDQRASARQGPTIMLHPKAVEHYQPPPPLPMNKLALYVGLPLSLAVVVLVVAGLFFGMRDSRRVALGNVMGSRRLGKLTHRRRDSREKLLRGSHDLLRKYTSDHESTGSDDMSEIERTASYAFKLDPSKLKSWKA